MPITSPLGTLELYTLLSAGTRPAAVRAAEALVQVLPAPVTAGMATGAWPLEVMMVTVDP